MEKFTNLFENKTTVDTDTDSNLLSELLEMVEESTNSTDNELQLKTIKSYIDDYDTNITGIINDSDIFDLYLKHRNEIDMLLSDNKHYDNSPDSIGAKNSVYDYVIISTKIAIQETFKNFV